MACLHANAEDRKCQMVVVSDDAALPRAKGITGARGVAGLPRNTLAGEAAAACRPVLLGRREEVDGRRDERQEDG